MNNRRYRMIRRWYFSWSVAGFVLVHNHQVTAHPIWGTRRELFERWREWDLGFTLSEMFKMDLWNGEPR